MHIFDRHDYVIQKPTFEITSEITEQKCFAKFSEKKFFYRILVVNQLLHIHKYFKGFINKIFLKISFY